LNLHPFIVSSAVWAATTLEKSVLADGLGRRAIQVLAKKN
jgi:hypothetical protein